MNVAKTPGRIHPLLAAASVSVILVSLIGIAAMTGILPNSHSTPAPVSEEASLAAPAQEKAQAPAESAPKVAAAETEAPARKPAPAHHHHSASVAHHAPSRTDYGNEPTTVASAAPQICETCGQVEAVEAIKHQAKASGGGAVAGALLGGVLGHQVGGGTGRKLATVAGAIGGGFAGNAIEKNARATTTYEVHVRMEDGSVRTFSYSAPPGLSAGERVRVVNGTLTVEG